MPDQQQIDPPQVAQTGADATADELRAAMAHAVAGLPAAISAARGAQAELRIANSLEAMTTAAAAFVLACADLADVAAGATKLGRSALATAMAMGQTTVVLPHHVATYTSPKRSLRYTDRSLVPARFRFTPPPPPPPPAPVEQIDDAAVAKELRTGRAVAGAMLEETGFGGVTFKPRTDKGVI